MTMCRNTRHIVHPPLGPSQQVGARQPRVRTPLVSATGLISGPAPATSVTEDRESGLAPYQHSSSPATPARAPSNGSVPVKATEGRESGNETPAVLFCRGLPPSAAQCRPYNTAARLSCSASHTTLQPTLWPPLHGLGGKSPQRQPHLGFILVSLQYPSYGYSAQRGGDCLENITKNYDDEKYPTMKDLMGAAQALTRLQDTYGLDVRELSEGILNGVVHSTPMTTGDCYELGQILYDNNDLKNALSWMMEAYRKFEEEDHKFMLPFTEGDIVEYIGFSHYLLGDIKLALQWTYKLLKLDPSNSRAIDNVPHYKKLISEEEANGRKRRRGYIEVSEQDLKDGITKEKTKTETEGPWRYSYKRETNNYLALCRGEIDVAADVSKRLKCWYSSENHPFLKYAPFKIEQMYITPDIFIFHDVMSDDEIELIKSISKTRFQRAVTLDPKTGEPLASPYRISKSSWLDNEESPVIARISQRVTDMTGLNMETAEPLQVVNYGIGGHYEPHFDFTQKHEKPFSSKFGNRIATVLFYMSEVAQGGATVFTELGITLFPIKGAAAFWMNLHPSGEGDMATRHAACPVLRGSKWVCSKWIHQGGHELIRPCTLEYQEEGVHNKLPQPVFKSFK